MFSGCFVLMNTTEVSYDLYLTISSENKVIVARYYPLKTYKTGTNDDIKMELAYMSMNKNTYKPSKGASHMSILEPPRNLNQPYFDLKGSDTCHVTLQLCS